MPITRSWASSPQVHHGSRRHNVAHSSWTANCTNYPDDGRDYLGNRNPGPRNYTFHETVLKPQSEAGEWGWESHRINKTTGFLENRLIITATSRDPRNCIEDPEFHPKPPRNCTFRQTLLKPLSDARKWGWESHRFNQITGCWEIVSTSRRRAGI